MEGGTFRTRTGGLTGRDTPDGAEKRPSSPGRPHTECNTPAQIFQISSSARRSPGESGPRIGVDGANGISTANSVHGGKPASGVSTQNHTSDRKIGEPGSGASGSFFKSRQQELPSSPSQSRQHFDFSESESPWRVHPGRRISVSKKQTRIDDADAGTIRTMQRNKPVAMNRRNTE